MRGHDPYQLLVLWTCARRQGLCCGGRWVAMQKLRRTVLLPSCTDMALLSPFRLLLLVSSCRSAGGGMPCAVSRADWDGDGDVTGAADRSLTCDDVLARVGCSDVVELVGPGAPPPRRARFLEIMTMMFTRASSCHVEKLVVHPHCCGNVRVFVWHSDQLQATEPNLYVMPAVTETHVCSPDSPLGKIPHGPHRGHPGTCALYLCICS